MYKCCMPKTSSNPNYHPKILPQFYHFRKFDFKMQILEDSLHLLSKVKALQERVNCNSLYVLICLLCCPVLIWAMNRLDLYLMKISNVYLKIIYLNISNDDILISETEE